MTCELFSSSAKFYIGYISGFIHCILHMLGGCWS